MHQAKESKVIAVSIIKGIPFSLGAWNGFPTVIQEQDEDRTFGYHTIQSRLRANTYRYSLILGLTL